MKKTDFNNFKISLNLNIEIDNCLRRITEKIKILSQLRDNDAMKFVIQFLNQADTDIDYIIETNCHDESEE